jgi:phytoene/squalene synthetase
MNEKSRDLAKAITHTSSKQTYITARLLVDEGLVVDCLRAYAYLRWVDDVIDIEARTRQDRITFINRQRELVARLYSGEQPEGLKPEEQLVADLIGPDRRANNGLHSFICNFLRVLEFDAERKGRLISQSELSWYSGCLGKSVTDGIQYFIGNDHTYPDSNERYLAATAAHITHMLRDMKEDLTEGFINIPREYLEACGINYDESRGLRPEDLDSPALRVWVWSQVELARSYFRQGKRYLDRLNVLRCKIAGYWYCARFEVVLDTIESDGYTLRDSYDERRKLATWLKFVQLGFFLTIEHLIQRLRLNWGIHRNLESQPLGSERGRCGLIDM